jgi:acetoin:2,6-dichlorophenolindophenol oxidoreductase subunit alpha
MAELISGDVLLEMYRRMWKIRVFEEAALAMQAKGEISGALHTSIGQEATVVGACLALREDDYMTGTHRSHGHPIAKGAKLAPLMAELFGKRTGVCKGKGGSMHLADFSVGSLGESGIVASAMPVAVGAGLSAQVRGTDQVCLCFFGDGAANEGAFHESLNLAATWRLPVVFVCENNGYAVSVSASRMMAVEDVASRASGYGMTGTVVDGQDVTAVYDVVSPAVARAREGRGPSLVEAKTYRFREHAEGLNVPRYRSEEEIAKWTARDPIAIHRTHLLDEGVSEGELDSIEMAVRTEVDDAVGFAQESPLPEPEGAFEDLYAGSFAIAR